MKRVYESENVRTTYIEQYKVSLSLCTTVDVLVLCVQFYNCNVKRSAKGDCLKYILCPYIRTRTNLTHT